MLLLSALLGASIVATTPLTGVNSNALDARDNATKTTKKWSYFASLGDSFAAGPGAGDVELSSKNASSKQCYRSALAYPEWLKHAGEFQNPHNNDDFFFSACAGSSYDDVTNQQLTDLDQNAGLVTLSIGANDSNIFGALTACIFGFDEPSNPCANSYGNQSAYLSNLQSDTGIYSPDASTNYFKMIDAIYKKLAFTKDNGTTIYQTTYPQLFDDYTDQCDTTSFSYSGTILKSQNLTKELREQLNFIVQQVNVLQQYWIDQANYNYNASYPVDFIRSANQDQLYNGHRFCRANVTEPDPDNAYTNFFNLLSQSEGGSFPAGHSSSTPGASVHAVNDNNGTASQFSSIDADTCSYVDNSNDLTSNLKCLTARAVKHGYKGPLPNPGQDASSVSAFAKVLHPKRFGHAAAGAEITSRSQYINGSTDFGVPLRILPVGDSITAGFQSTTGGGYREFLYNILRINNSNVTFIGAQNTASNSSWGHCDGYYGDTSVQIRGNLSEHGSLKKDPNVVIIMSGTNDIGKTKVSNFTGLLPNAAQLEGIITDVFNATPNAAVLVGHIIARGINVFEAKIGEQEKLTLQWNANINVMVNRLKTQHPEWRLRYVHTTPTTFDHFDGLHPDDRGYMKLAADFAEGLSQLAAEKAFVAPDS